MKPKPLHSGIRLHPGEVHSTNRRTGKQISTLDRLPPFQLRKLIAWLGADMPYSEIKLRLARDFKVQTSERALSAAWHRYFGKPVTDPAPHFDFIVVPTGDGKVRVRAYAAKKGVKAWYLGKRGLNRLRTGMEASL